MSSPIVCAMSGGVDSSVAALLLNQEGHDVIGVSMQVWDYRQHGGCSDKATCCAPDDFTDARKCAAKIGVPYYVFDLEAHFKEEVIDRFVDFYKRGVTPNPCADCNKKVKFAELRNRAKTFGAGSVATGHYARIINSGERLKLLRGRDRSKDQSYFLYGLTYEELSKTVFPVGDMTKPEVRELAAMHGLVTAEKPESQDVCFVSGGLKSFLEKMGVAGSTGEFRTSRGESLGRHDGFEQFTVGQRRGLHLGGLTEPAYVLEIHPETSTVIVGPKEELDQEEFTVSEISFVQDELFARSAIEDVHAIAQLRYRHDGVPVTFRRSGDTLKVKFEKDRTTVSPGQACVFYNLDNEEVLGGGRIVFEKRFK